MTFEEKTIESEQVFKGKIFNIRRDKVTVVNGGTSYRDVLEHNGGAVVAALTAENKMVMVRQYRKPAGRVVFEVPAGKIDPGEAPMDAALRELKEETGYTAETCELISEFYPTVGYSEEKLYLYLCRGLTPGETDFDETEALDMEEWDIDSLYDMVVKQEIQDAKTIIAILMIKNLL